MERWQAHLKNLYKYDKIEAEIKGGVRLRIKTVKGMMSTNLPLKYIKLYRHINEVEIPEWLCERIGLL